MDRFANKLHFLEHGRTKVENYSGELLLSTRNPVFGIEMLNLFRNSKIVLNMHIGVAGNYAGNMRLFEVTGVGSCLLTDDKQNIKELFEPGKEIITYNGPRDCINKAKWLLDHDDERRDIALAGHERTLQSHTVNRRCEYIAGILEAELKRKQ
jgi:spore maturation protein CgeB